MAMSYSKGRAGAKLCIVHSGASVVLLSLLTSSAQAQSPTGPAGLLVIASSHLPRSLAVVPVLDRRHRGLSCRRRAGIRRAGHVDRVVRQEHRILSCPPRALTAIAGEPSFSVAFARLGGQRRSLFGIDPRGFTATASICRDCGQGRHQGTHRQPPRAP
jgi:hypothetical protein